MKKLLMIALGAIVMSSSLWAGTYTFTNRYKNSVFLEVCAATCNCQKTGELQPGATKTFGYGGCCLDYVKVSDADREYDWYTRPGWGGGVDRDPHVLLGQIRCSDGRWNITADANGNFKLEGY